MYNLQNIFGFNPTTFIVAEIGINHGGNFDYAKKLIEKAREAGADAVKFQVFKTEKFYNPKLAKNAYDLFKSLELSYEEYLKLSEFANSMDLIFFGTPLDLDSLKFLDEINTPIFKIASSDISCEPFLKAVADTAKISKKIVFLSTGFAKMKMIKRAVSFFNDVNLCLLYCVSKYPVQASDIDLNVLKTFKEKFLMPIGFSDHSLNYIFDIAAIALGAKIIEKHFTTDNTINSLDHPISLNPADFKNMVNAIREIEIALKSGEKELTDFERKIAPLSMRKMYLARDIKKGEKISKEDVLLLRPGDGVKISDYKSRIGKKLKTDKQKYEEV
ncbi:MAG: N-acetylneuraminate synthase family protein [Brevinematales bacterium]|nr:N-acetylneuraminate synthase family protein [Brevinematales bacterium]